MSKKLKVTETYDAEYSEKQLKRSRLLAIIALILALTSASLSRCSYEDARNYQEKNSSTYEQTQTISEEYIDTIKGK